MNFALVPNFCALLVFIGAFRPLARRAGPHTDAWFLGWLFLVLHNAALILAGPASVHHVSVALCGEWALELAGICFLRAASNAPRTLAGVIFSLEMALPILAQSTLVAFNVHRPLLHAFVTLCMLAPGIHVFFQRSERTRTQTDMAWGFAICAVCLAPFAALDPPMALSVVHCLLFLGSASLYWDYAEHTTPGVFTAVSGLALWGLVYPTDMLLRTVHIQSAVLTALWQLPSYIFAYGMILTLIEEHVRRTEALALHDTLTGLPNRRLFEDRLEQALAVAPKSGAMLACIVIDVDNFKQTNDTLGHAAGDTLLKSVATRLSWHIHAGDTLARTGGDEFCVVLPRLQSLEHLRFTVGALMSATSAPVIVGEASIPVGLSVGIALYPDSATDAEGLRQRADAAMYDAKRQGGNRFAYADGQPDEVGRLLAGVPADLRRFPSEAFNIPRSKLVRL